MWRELPGFLGSCMKRWVMGNPLYLALRLVLGAQTPAVRTAQLEDSKALFSFVSLCVCGGCVVLS